LLNAVILMGTIFFSVGTVYTIKLEFTIFAHSWIFSAWILWSDNLKIQTLIKLDNWFVGERSH